MIHCGDLFDVLPTLEAESIDACVCDPPYGIGFMGKEWDTFDADPVEASWSGKGRNHKVERHSKYGTSGVGFRKTNPRCASCGRAINGRDTAKGFKVCKCENPTLAPLPNRDALRFEEWTALWAAEVFRVLKPGAHIVVCGAPRAYHRMACGIEDAGFEIRDCFAWLFGSGFPKSLNLGDGRGTALKPAWESITVAQKPYESERRLISESLLQLEARIWSLLPASVAESHFSFSPSEYAEACASAQWSADDRSNTLAGLCEATDTLPFVSVIRTSLNIVSSWNAILAASLRPTNTSIIETRSRATIDWRTLKSCALVLTPRDIILAAISPPGSRFDASPAARYLNAALRNISSILELSALEPVISAVPPRFRVAVEKEFSTAHEPIVLARKPFKGSVRSNVEQYGTGALNIDACRIEPSVNEPDSGAMFYKNRGLDMPENRQNYFRGKDSTVQSTPIDGGRWPANVVLDDLAALVLDEMSGELTSGELNDRYEETPSTDGIYGSFKRRSMNVHADVGGASRFFYCAKPSREERDMGCYDLPAKSGGEATDRDDGTAGLNNPRAGAGRTGGRHGVGVRNFHPT